MGFGPVLAAPAGVPSHSTASVVGTQPGCSIPQGLRTICGGIAVWFWQLGLLISIRWPAYCALNLPGRLATGTLGLCLLLFYAWRCAGQEVGGGQCVPGLTASPTDRTLLRNYKQLSLALPLHMYLSAFAATKMPSEAMLSAQYPHMIK